MIHGSGHPPPPQKKEEKCLADSYLQDDLSYIEHELFKNAICKVARLSRVVIQAIGTLDEQNPFGETDSLLGETPPHICLQSLFLLGLLD